MLRKSLYAAALVAVLSAAGLAQNTNTSTTPAPAMRGKRVTTAQPSPTPSATTQGQTSTTEAGARREAAAKTPQVVEAERGVREAFDTLVDGIRRADVETVMGVYWNSPQLTLFNNNGTVTRAWEQVRSNRASSYPNLKDVKLDVRDVRVQLLSTQSALVTCLWAQSQIVRGASETATGRLTLVLQKIGGAWKVVHTHTSPDAPDPSRLPASERPATTEEDATPAKPPVKP